MDDDEDGEGGGDGTDPGDVRSFAALRRRLAAAAAANGGGAAGAGEGARSEGEEEEDGAEEEEEEEEAEEAGGTGAAAAAATRAEVQRLLEEYYKLDYEDVVAGMPTRFRCVCGRGFKGEGSGACMGEGLGLWKVGHVCRVGGKGGLRWWASVCATDCMCGGLKPRVCERVGGHGIEVLTPGWE
jgi:hypothetical protein